MAIRMNSYWKLGVAALIAWHPATAFATPELVNSDRIITSDDYPVESIRRGEDGVSTLELTVSNGGTLTHCRISSSSGYSRLDEKACELMKERGIFIVRKNGTNTLIKRITWRLNSQPPRAMFLGHSVEKQSYTNDGRLKCHYSDGKVRVVDTGRCTVDIPIEKAKFIGKNKNVDIVENYLNNYEFSKDGATAFNIGMLLLENDYDQAVHYLSLAERGGIPHASIALCGIKSSKYSVFFDPKSAIDHCINAQRFGIDAAIITLKSLKDANPSWFSSQQSAMVDYWFSEKPTVLQRPRLRVDATKLVQSRDYPHQTLRNSISGSTNALFYVDEHGRVGNCVIIRSSYSYYLDKVTCEKIRERGLYYPAFSKDRNIAQWTNQRVHWVVGNQERKSGGIFEAILGLILLAI